MPQGKATTIMDEHFPGRGAAAAILDENFPGRGVATTIMDEHFPGRGTAKVGPRGPRWGRLPVDRVGPTVKTPPSALARAIADNAAATKAAGGSVDINVWAGALEQNGVSQEVIAAAYNGAGGDAVLAPAEAAGTTGAFLGAFVQGMESRGVDPAIIAGTYQQAGGTL